MAIYDTICIATAKLVSEPQQWNLSAQVLCGVGERLQPHER